MADPLAKLGRKTKAAIEEMSRGFPDQQSYLTNWALTEVMKLDEDEANDAEVDADLAQRIYDGDPGMSDYDCSAQWPGSAVDAGICIPPPCARVQCVLWWHDDWGPCYGAAG
jgi:hypothetical protein